MSNSEFRSIVQFLVETNVLEKPVTDFNDILKEAQTFKNMLERKELLVNMINEAETELDFLIPAIEDKKERMKGLLCLR